MRPIVSGRFTRYAAVTAVGLTLLAPALGAQDSTPVVTADGPVTGVDRDGVISFGEIVAVRQPPRRAAFDMYVNQFMTVAAKGRD